MDQALLRRGRFGKKLYVPLPNQDQRGLILKALAKKKQLDADVDLVAIGQSNACANFSGADLYALVCVFFSFTSSTSDKYTKCLKLKFIDFFVQISDE